jgi:hypothetical protein
MLYRVAELCSIACGLLALAFVVVWLVVYAARPVRSVGRLGGMVTLFAGAFVLVALALAVTAYVAYPAGPEAPRLFFLTDWLIRTIPTIAFLIGGRWIITGSLRTFRLKLHNDGPHTIAEARLEAPGAHLLFSELKPGESATKRFTLVADGAIDLMIRIGDQTHDHRLADHANRLHGEHFVATLKGDVVTIDRIER